jgi:hypothetical protein
MKLILGSLALFFTFMVAISVVGVALNLITIPWLGFSSKVQMNRDVVKKTYNADNALYNYHWFQERAGSIKALDQQIVIADKAVTDFETSAGPRKEWTFEDKNEASRLRSVAQGLKNERKSQVEEYNAKAGEADKAMFVDGLPLFFNL